MQRFKAIGQLVGGVAHDSNNLLMVVTGALDLTLRDRDLSLASRRMVDMSMRAARRGAKLTDQLLTFARKQILQPTVLNPNEVITDLQAFLASAVDETVEVIIDLGPVVWPVYLDRTQFETALVNLALNARDALDGQGSITISTRNETMSVKAPAGCDNEYWPTCADKYWPTPRCLIC